MIDAVAQLAQVVTELVASRGGEPRPVLTGIGGGVAVGKTTAAARLHDALLDAGVRSEVLGTDCFLFSNAHLDARGLAARKGFPESFDTAAAASTLDALRSGAPSVDVPVYSHEIYDIAEGVSRAVSSAPVVIVEGVNVLWSPIVERLDVAVYLDADEADVRRWFFERFDDLCAAPEPGSFYEPIAALDVATRHALATAAWDSINVVNLREHIAPARMAATHVIAKGSDHEAHSLEVTHPER